MGYLSRDFREAYTILEKAQVGVSGGQDEWRECVEATDAALGPALGAMYVRKAFSQDARHMVRSLLIHYSLFPNDGYFIHHLR